jgi:hypothetical protein
VAAALARLFAPSTPSDWIRIGSLAAIALVCAGAAAAYIAARRGISGRRA